MNRFAKSGSRLFVVLTTICILSLFGDGANLTDLFSETTTVHFDEVNNESENEITVPSHFQFAQSFSDFVIHRSVSKQVLPCIKRVILDQDSPSLEAVSIFTSETHIAVPRDAAVTVPFVLYSESLYLEHRTLLI